MLIRGPGGASLISQVIRNRLLGDVPPWFPGLFLISVPLDQEFQATARVHTVLEDLVENIRASFAILMAHVLFCGFERLGWGIIHG